MVRVVALLHHRSSSGVPRLPGIRRHSATCATCARSVDVRIAATYLVCVTVHSLFAGLFELNVRGSRGLSGSTASLAGTVAWPGPRRPGRVRRPRRAPGLGVPLPAPTAARPSAPRSIQFKIGRTRIAGADVGRGRGSARRAPGASGERAGAGRRRAGITRRETTNRPIRIIITLNLPRYRYTGTSR